VKHHDGFCLWPTQTTDHNATKAGNPYTADMNIPKDFAEAAKDLGLKYGFYISPWDRNSVHYGTDRYVPEVFLRQCAELAQYGNDQFEMWFDGANGGDGYYGGRRGTVNVGDANIYYDVPNLRDTVHKVQPNCVLWGVGGEARWIGNEAGWAGETNWCMGHGTDGDINGWYWHPGESDAKATNKGWFYHDYESPHSAERLFQMYLETVGRNATLILNWPPNKAGVLPASDVKVLEELGKMIEKRLGTDLAKNAKIEASETRAAGANRTYGVDNLVDGNTTTYWATNDGTKQATLTFTWDTPQALRYVSLMELVAKGQRVKKFKLEISQDGTNFKPVAENVAQTTIGYKRIIPLNGSTVNSYSAQGIQAKALRITIEDAKACPLLKSVAIY
jgi:F5/8 type C domain protein